LKALSVGGAMVDTIVIIDDDLIERISMTNAEKTFLLLEQGSKTEATSISTHCGGGAVNAAVSLARQGYNTLVLAKTGADQRADLIRERLLEEHVDTSSLLVSREAPTGASIIVSAHDRNAAVFTFRGANTRIFLTDLEAANFAVDLVYVSTLSGDSADILPYIVRKSAALGAMTAVNPGIRQITTRFRTLCSVLPEIGVLAMNRLEAEHLVRQAIAELAGSENSILRRIVANSFSHGDELRRVSRHDTARALIAGLRHLGAKTVLLTDGKQGAYVGHAEATLYCPAQDARVGTSIGAGDAFVSTFTGNLVREENYEKALGAAIANSASVVAEVDAQTGLLSRSMLEQRLIEADYSKAIQMWAAE
jgi:ribokinase